MNIKLIFSATILLLTLLICCELQADAVSGFEKIQDELNPNSERYSVGNGLGDLTLNYQQEIYPYISVGFFNSTGELCGYANRHWVTSQSKLLGMLSTPDTAGSYGLLYDESPSYYVLIIDWARDGIGDWDGTQLTPRPDDVVLYNIMVTNFTAAYGTSRELGTWAVLSPEPVLGDTDWDRDVDSIDYLNFINAFGLTSPSSADFNHDGIVDLSDFVILRTNFGTSVLSPGPEQIMVPEPATILLLGFLGIGMIRRRRKNAY